MELLDWHLNQSDPGDSLHHLAVALHVVVDDADVQTHMYAIASDGPDPDQMIAGAILAAVDKARDAGKVIAFVTLSQEMWTVGRQDWDEQAKLLHAERKLEEHPKAVEATIIYGACADGRRWRGRRYLTGPRAGETADVEMLVGAPMPGESKGIRTERLLRWMVGLSL